MAVASTDFFQEVGNPGTATTLAAPGHTIGGTSFIVGSTTNWPTTTGATFAIDTYDIATGLRVPGSYTEWSGVVASSTSITGGVLRYGTDQNYSAGATTRVYIPVSSSRENRLVQGLTTTIFDQDGTIKAGAVDNAAALASNVVTTAKILDANVTATKLGTGIPVQKVSVVSSSVSTGTTIMPADNTIPQITEGTEFMTLAITPTSATNILVIEVTAMLSGSGVDAVVGALFQDATANALAASEMYHPVNSTVYTRSIVHSMTAGTTSSTTFRFRAGTNGAGTVTFNGAGGTVRFGAISKSGIIITEVKV